MVANEVLTLPLSTHCAAEHGRMLLPVTVNVIAGLATAADDCESVGMPGAESAVVGVNMVNGKPFEVPGEELEGSLNTETVAVPGNAVSAGEIEAVS